MKNVTYTSGWNGGSYQVDGQNFSFKKKETYWANINGYDVLCFVKTIHDQDIDHGTTYSWSRNDLYFKADVFGIILELSALPYIEKGLFKLHDY